MRLLNTGTKTLETFQGQVTPDYAILSHVWEEEEVSFQDINNADFVSVHRMKGFSKITAACEMAVNDGLHYLWIDTCCINKESSAELSEAINSMFLWYKNSQVCYAFLSDVLSDEDPSPSYSSFAMSKWFTRGWTLQELLAPIRVVFYGADWVQIGTKTTLQKTITAITGIEERIILEGGIVQYDSVPIAVRMSWAAERQTTRVEDIAYCLMGLFNVNMPLLYGEGRKAFIRLQHEIIRKSNDQSIFAWRAERVEDTTPERGLLARSPSEFYDSTQVSAVTGKNDDDDYAITNRGIRIKLITHDPEHEPTVAHLNCSLSGKQVGIHIKKIDTNQYIRVHAHNLFDILPKMVLESSTANEVKISTLFILDDVPDVQPKIPAISTLLEIIPSPEYGDLEYADLLSWKRLGPTKWTFEPWLGITDGLFVILNTSRTEQCAVAVGIKDGMVWADIFTGFDFKRDMKNLYTSYFCTQNSITPRKFCRGLDGPSVDLSSGWTAYLKFGILETSLGDKAQHITLRFQETSPPTPMGPLWKRPSFPGEVIYLITCPAPHHYFTIVERDLFPITSYGHWPPGTCNRSFIVGVPSSISESFIIPFKKSSAGPRVEFFIVLGKNSYGLFRSSIEMKRPDAPSRVLEVRGKTDKSYTMQLDSGERVSMTIRRCRDTSIADFIINVSLQDSHGIGKRNNLNLHQY